MGETLTKRGGKSLHAFIMREAASTGQLKEKPRRPTLAQWAMLIASAQRCFKDNSGPGYALYDGQERRIARRLVGAGWATLGMPTFGAPLGYLRITTEGRAALASHQSGDAT